VTLSNQEKTVEEEEEEEMLLYEGVMLGP